MRSNLSTHAATWHGKRHFVNIVITITLMLWCGLSYAYAQQCSFSSSSDGSDGNYDLTGTAAGTTVYFNAANFHGSGVANNVFNFNKIIIPTSVKVKFTENAFHGPVYWLAQSDVTIAGTLDLTGADANLNQTDPTTRQPSPGGSGGYPGGVGGGGTLGFIALPGGGPGGGAAGVATLNNGAAQNGIFAGSNQFLVPLVGGSGGGGGIPDPRNGPTSGFGFGGAGGGGAVLIASNTSVVNTGTITAQGGNAGDCGTAGSGGSILLVANSISNSGNLIANGGGAACVGQAPSGLLRLEACSISGNLSGNTGGYSVVSPPALTSTPVTLFLPTTTNPSVQVTSVNGIAIKANPFTFPDIQINTASSIPVVITAHQVPVSTVPTLYVFSESGDQQLQCTGGLQGTLATSTCTINLTFPYGGSRGFVKVTWTP